MLTVSDTGQGVGGAKSFYDGQRSDSKVSLEKQPNKEARDQPRTDRTETRYENYNLPRTFEGLEQSFREDIILLSKELQDAEDAENSRHREVCQMHSDIFLWCILKLCMIQPYADIARVAKHYKILSVCHFSSCFFFSLTLIV